MHLKIVTQKRPTIVYGLWFDYSRYDHSTQHDNHHARDVRGAHGRTEPTPTTICIAKHPHDFFVINTLSMWRNFVGHLEPFHLECNSKNSPTCSDRKLCILVLEMMLLIAGGSTRGREHHRKIFEYKVVRRYGIKNTCCRSPVHSESLSHAALS